MLDLALGLEPEQPAAGACFLVAPDEREEEVRAQLARPAFNRVRDLALSYLPYGELRRHRDAIARFGSGLKAVRAVAKPLT
jgi:type II restriction enzyme